MASSESMNKVSVKFLQIALLDYAVNKAPSVQLWRCCNYAYLMSTSNDLENQIDWKWIKKHIGYSMQDIDLEGLFT